MDKRLAVVKLRREGKTLEEIARELSYPSTREPSLILEEYIASIGRDARRG
jgi:hypothetical protein